MSRGRAQTVERLENELEVLMANLQAEPAYTSFDVTPDAPSGFTLEDALEGRPSALAWRDTGAAVPQHEHTGSRGSGGLSHGSGSRKAASEQDLEALLARLDDEERQIRDDIKRMRDDYARSLRRGYLTKGAGKPGATAAPTSPPPEATAVGDAEAHRELEEAERKVTVLRQRAEEVRKSIMLANKQKVSGFGVHGPSGGSGVRRKRVIGDRRGDQGGGGEGSELRELELELKKMEQDHSVKEDARRRAVSEREEEDRTRKLEADGRVRVTLEMAKMLLRDEAAKQEEDERREAARRDEEESREVERKMAAMRDRIERMRIMAQVKQRQQHGEAMPQTPSGASPATATATTTRYSACPPSPLTPPSNLPPLSPAAVGVSPIWPISPTPSSGLTTSSPLTPPFHPSLGVSPSVPVQRQFYYTTQPVPRPSVPPLLPASSNAAAPGIVPRPNFSPRSTSSSVSASAFTGVGGGGTKEDDSELNSMMSDMLKHLKASNPQTDVKDVSSPIIRSGRGGMSGGGPPPVPSKKPSALTASPTLSADPKACGRCGKTVSEYGDVVQAMDRRWHPECFVCFSCRGELMGQRGGSGGTYYPRDGQPHCTACYRRVCGQ